MAFRVPGAETACARPMAERSLREQTTVDVDGLAQRGWRFGFLCATVGGGVGVGATALAADYSLPTQVVIGALSGFGSLVLVLLVVYAVCRLRAPGKLLEETRRELGKERRPDTFLEADAVYTQRRVQRYLSDPVACDQPRFEVAHQWVSRTWMNFQEFGRHGLLKDLQIYDGFPEAGDVEGQRVYLARRLRELDEVIERLRRGD